MKTCEVSGCNRIHFGKGLCAGHYSRKARTGRVDGHIPLKQRKTLSAGDKSVHTLGYVWVAGEGAFEHVMKAEAALGKPLPRNVVVHHVDEDKTNNTNSNLLICTRKYHNMIHMRMRALDESGKAGNMKCPICKQWDDPRNMQKNTSGGFRHKECHRLYEFNRRNNKESNHVK